MGYRAAWLGCNNINDNLNLNANNYLNNSNAARGIALAGFFIFMNELYNQLCTYENLERAFRKARKGKTTKPYVVEFEKNLKENLNQLRTELIFHTYLPKPLKTFILRDPKTRKINKSAFRDRIVHHALCNVIELLFERTFIHDSYANRHGKGVLKAIERFDVFKRKVSHNLTRACFVLKADIYHYFETVNYATLLSMIKKRIKDERVLWLIRCILANYKKTNERERRRWHATRQSHFTIFCQRLSE